MKPVEKNREQSWKMRGGAQLYSGQERGELDYPRLGDESGFLTTRTSWNILEYVEEYLKHFQIRSSAYT